MKYYLLIDLQGSQTEYTTTWKCNRFYILIDLQGSQTVPPPILSILLFYILIDLQGSQTRLHNQTCVIRFTYLLIYKVLKPQNLL